MLLPVPVAPGPALAPALAARRARARAAAAHAAAQAGVQGVGCSGMDGRTRRGRREAAGTGVVSAAMALAGEGGGRRRKSPA